MSKAIKWTAGVVAFIMLIGGAYLLYTRLSDKYAGDGLVTEAPPPNDTTPNGDQTENGTQDSVRHPAPDFTVTDYSGAKVSLSDKKGKPVVINFWASWCYYCKVEMPDFEEMYKKYGDRVEFMIVNMTDAKRETVDIAKDFIKKQGYTFPVYFDTMSDAAYTYNVTGLPATYFVDSEGNAVAMANGMIQGETLEKGIGMIID